MMPVVRKCTIVLQFYAAGPESDEQGDEWADELGDGIVLALETNTPNGIFDQSFKVLDWTDEPEEHD